MILYFTGTGNSRYIAQRIADKLGDSLLNMNEKIKADDTTPVEVDGRLILVVPTYAWRIPGVVRDWLTKTELRGATQAWFVMNCGDQIGNAAKYNRQLCDKKGLTYMGTAQIIMPENYIAMFGTPEPEQARQIIRNAEPVIDARINDLAAGREFSIPRNNLYDKVMSGLVNGFFYKTCIKTKDFRVDDRCVACETCVKVCPLNNVTIKDGKPFWGTDCTHCMACISYCPTKAIEYGKKSGAKTRYTIESVVQLKRVEDEA